VARGWCLIGKLRKRGVNVSVGSHEMVLAPGGLPQYAVYVIRVDAAGKKWFIRKRYRHLLPFRDAVSHITLSFLYHRQLSLTHIH
jgi:hypothetical protein